MTCRIANTRSVRPGKGSSRKSAVAPTASFIGLQSDPCLAAIELEQTARDSESELFVCLRCS